MRIDAKGVYYRDLNESIRAAIAGGEKAIELVNVNGQRYIGNGISAEDVTITINGVPGNDLAAFMNGPTIVVKGNAQDGVANTMNGGKIYIHGHVGDILGYGMRGGSVFVKGNVGYRVGIHMKGYEDKVPRIIAGGCAGDFFGEYMAGGILVLLGLNCDDGRGIVGDFCATGIHGGAVFIRGEVEPHKLGAEVGITEPDNEDMALLEELVGEYCRVFGADPKEVFSKPFLKHYPYSSRPYGRLYAY
jgi:glutamate synthase domain-containing protein 3